MLQTQSPSREASEETGGTSRKVNRVDTASSTVKFPELVARIQAGDENAMTELYGLFSRGIRFYLYRQLGPQELDDRVHDAFLIVVQAIRNGDLRDPERLMGFVRTIVRRQVAAHIEQAVHTRREHVDLEGGVRLVDRGETPEEGVMHRQKAELVRHVLEGLAPRDREVLTRFYLYEQTQEQICEQMSLTETQFRLLKYRAKARFGELGRKKLAQGSGGNETFMRNSAGGTH
jgi:RNA polymerase sigma factor (sigma-70 family)